MLNTNVELVGQNPKFRKAVDHARSLAVTKSPALIQGEVGTGKKTLCSFIHQNSARSTAAFVVVDCSLDPLQVEREILGFRDETGKFHRGALERCNKGTVVFANIDSMDEEFQKKLFNIIKELSDYELDVRILATTSKNLAKQVGAGRFNRALYSYLTSSQIALPTLRERTGDVELIAQYYVEINAKESNIEVPTIATEVIDRLNNQNWSQNVSELVSVIDQAMTKITEGQITLTSVESADRKVENNLMDDGDEVVKLMSLREAEKLLIKKALIHTAENRTQAAKILGVSIRTLRNKINEYRTEGASYFVNLR